MFRYLDTVYPEMPIPNQRDSNIKYNTERPIKKTVAQGPISVAGLSICLYAEPGAKSMLRAGPCRENSSDTIWNFNDKGIS